MYSVNAANKRFLLWQWSIKYHLNICIFTPIKLIHKFSKWYLKKTKQDKTALWDIWKLNFSKGEIAPHYE